MRKAPWIVALAAGCAATPDACDDPAVRAAIAEAWDEHLAAVRRKDPAGVGLLYADDVVYVVPGECEVRGRRRLTRWSGRGSRTSRSST